MIRGQRGRFLLSRQGQKNRPPVRPDKSERTDPMNITKEATLTAETLTPEDLALINRLSKKTLKPE